MQIVYHMQGFFQGLVNHKNKLDSVSAENRLMLKFLFVYDVVVYLEI
jgi:hypothetical protein